MPASGVKSPAINERTASLITLNRALMVHQLMRGIAHDLRNNLQVVSLGAGAARSPETIMGKRIEESVDHMIGVLDVMSSLGRDPDPTPRCSLDGVLSEVRTMAAMQTIQPPAELVISAEAPGRTIQVPAWAAVQMVMNLVTNAKEALSVGNRRVVVRASAPAERAAKIVIEGDGAGPPIQFPELFTTTKDRRFHAGIGLFVTRSLAEQFGGSLTIESLLDGRRAAALLMPLAAER